MKVPALLSLTLAISSWGLAPVFIRLLRDAYDPYSQAFIRYLFATLILVTVCALWFRGEFAAILHKPLPLAGIACINIIHQVTWTLGCYQVSATLAQLITQLGIVFVILLSYLLFREERGVISSPFYLTGAALSLAGMAIVLMGGGNAAGAIGFTPAMLLLTTAVCWAAYAVSAKHLVADCHPIPMFAALAIFITAGTGVIAALFGSPSCLIRVSAWTVFLTLLSSALPLAAAHPAYHFAQKYLGSAFSSTCNVLSPLLTCLFAAVLLNDPPLTPGQWIGAAILLTGTVMVVRKRTVLPEDAPTDVGIASVRTTGQYPS